MDTGTQNERWAYQLIDALITQGIDYFCVAPGSRSTPLALGIANHPKAKHIVHFDERGLCFHAVGYGKATQKPAVVISTSGTAVGNWMPAIIESCNDRVPLILLSADRPPELRDCGSNQTCDQVKLFNNFIRWQIDLPCPDEQISERYLASTIGHAVATSMYPLAGPVHLNCMFREPLFSNLKTHYPIEHHVSFERPTLHPSKQSICDWKKNLTTKRKGVILVGSCSSEIVEEVLALAEMLKWPIFADILSPLRTVQSRSSLITHFDPILKLKNSVSVDAIIQFGDRFVSKTLMQWLEKQSLEFYLHVADHWMRQDPSHLVTHRVQSCPKIFIRELLLSLEGVAKLQFGTKSALFAQDFDSAQIAYSQSSMSICAESEPVQKSSNLASKASFATPSLTAHEQTDWKEEWHLWNQQCKQALREFFSEQPLLSEPGLIWEIAPCMPKHWDLFIGNSMPIRDFNQFFSPSIGCGKIFGNRGASGIDGNIATACGIAQGNEKPTLAVIGDLTCLHDLNSLAMLSQVKYPMILCVINNAGGGIFSFLPISKRKEVFEEFIATPHPFTFQAAASLFNIPYFHPETPTQFRDLLKDQTRSCLIEITTARNENVQVHEQILKHISTCLNSAHSSVEIPATLH